MHGSTDRTGSTGVMIGLASDRPQQGALRKKGTKNRPMKEDLNGISRYRRFRTFSRKLESGILEEAKGNLGERLMCRINDRNI